MGAYLVLGRLIGCGRRVRFDRLRRHVIARARLRIFEYGRHVRLKNREMVL